MQRTGALLLRYGGTTTRSGIPASYQVALDSANNSVESDYPKVVEAKIQGSVPHTSSKDKSDEKEVITVSYHTEAGTRVTSVHIHDDNTFKEFPSRNANKGK